MKVETKRSTGLYAYDVFIDGQLAYHLDRRGEGSLAWTLFDASGNQSKGQSFFWFKRDAISAVKAMQ